MTISDYESKFDEIERDNLQNAIAEVERTLASAGTQKPMPLANFVENAKGRIAALDRKIKESQAERESRAREQVAITHLAQKEAALSAAEKETYSGFLGKEFFTKNDFASLETFYAQTWDRLSEGGKDEMSHRVWEGIRREEFTFSELPEIVREKEAKRAYKVLSERTVGAGSTKAISEKDRLDFLRSYEAGEHDEAEKILDRESFKKTMFQAPESKAIKSAAVQADRESAGRVTNEKIAAGQSQAGQKQADQNAGEAKNGLLDIKLDGLELVEASGPASSADMPRAANSPAKHASSLGNG